MNEKSPSAKYMRISLLLFSLSVTLGTASIACSELKLGAYGLIHSLPPTFFVALFLLALSFLITVKFNVKNRAFLFIHIIALVLLLYLLPALIEKTARFAPAYLVYGSTDYVLQHGHIEPSVSVYMKWPGITLLGVSVSEIAGLSPSTLLIGFPIAFELICLPLLYSILNRVSRNQHLVWIGLWLYFVASWINRAYYSGQAYGFLLFLVIVFVILLSARRKGEIRPTERGAIPIILVVLFLAIAASHLLSSIVAGVSLVILYILFRIFKVGGARSIGFMIPVFLVAALVWLFLLGGDAFFRDILQGPSGRWELFNFGAIFKRTFQVPFSGGAEHATIMLLRAIYTGAFCALALFGLFNMVIKKKMHFDSTVMLGLLAGACSVIVLVGSYGGEIVYRAFEFSLLFLAFFAAKSLGSKALSIPLVIFLIVSPVLFVASAYANEKADYISPGEIKGVEFFHDHVTDDAEVHSLTPRIWRSRNIELNYWRPLLLESMCSAEGNTTKSDEKERYFLLGERDVDSRIFLGGELEVGIEDLRVMFESSCRAKVYSSDGFDLYR